ncbi:hypothetical protein [Pseudoalteromonas denitrificans]|uniref:Lipoprotein n=1 Tax=Pseudoalteromonas denitrificans DSM 6059 TaxID=1123010 RepID=A0A1I1QCH1_9GAMM|nr:hypothetical protein [Pseudoalteromonas denitrificans]SFD19735.1 hypothetical protein SAMN02745724_03830 [Pseudoalteromonas denitrificans DSM 6059]
MKVLIFLTLTLLSGCQLIPEPVPKKSQLEIAGLAFYNNTDFEINQISLKVKATGRMVACTSIGPKSYCGTGFPVKYYQAAQLIVFWKDNQSQEFEHDLIIPFPKKYQLNTPYIAVLKIKDNGQFESFFRVEK